MSNAEISSIHFSSYKKFNGDECIEIKPVTILVGKNSSGKSSIAKLFPMFGNSLSGTQKQPISFKNDDVELGVSLRSITHNGELVGLKFGVEFSNDIYIEMSFLAGNKGEVVVIEYVLKYNGENYVLKIDNKNKDVFLCEKLKTTFSYSSLLGFIHNELFETLGIHTNHPSQDNYVDFSQKIDYVGPLRKTPERTRYDVGEEVCSVGYDGDKAYAMLYQDDHLQSVVSKWFEDNFDGAKLKVKKIQDAGGFQIVLNKPYMGEYDVNISDEGMGIGQVFPIIVRCHKKEEGSIVVMEQPELHLHPAAHASLAKLFAETSKKNNQRYVVETHSQNLLLGLREAVVDPNCDFSSEDVIIYFVDEDEDGSFLRKIEIKKNGELSDWPESVFEESYELIKSINKKVQMG